MNDRILDKVVTFTAEKRLFSAPCHVLVGVSGGADSMSLLHMLLHWPDDYLTVSAIHINHGLRGEAADRDETFVKNFCDSHHIPLTIIAADVAAIAKAERLTVEEAGRKARYEAFEKVRVATSADYVLTAHTADDQAETVLMHIVRGCGINGLIGIADQREYIRRPLLCCSRADVESYCSLHQVPYVVDESNNDIRFSRNLIRHRVLPVLREMNPSVTDALLRLSHSAQTDVAFLNEQAKEAMERARCNGGYRAEPLAEYPEAIRRRVIHRMMLDASLSSVTEAYIVAADKAILSNDGLVHLSNGHLFSVEQGFITVRAGASNPLPAAVTVESLPSVEQFGDFICTLSEHPIDVAIVHNLFSQCAVDRDKINGKLHWRTRVQGDYMHPCGRGVGKSIKKLMNEWQIPAHLRDGYPLLCDESGIILVPGYTCDERVSITETTKHYLECEMDVVQG